jgi:glycine cleavage system H protein
MNEIVEFLKIAGLFTGGLLFRTLLLVLVIAAYSIPFFAAWGLYSIYRRAQGHSFGLEKVDGLLIAGDRHYSSSHTWIAPRLFGSVRIGLDDIAQRIVPGATTISLPYVGTALRKGDNVAVIACGDRQASIVTPIEGTVIAVNHGVGRNPHLLNEAPYGKGWLYALRPADDTWQKLPTGSAAREWVRAEERRLSHFIEQELGMAAADGGDLIVPGPTALPKERWNVLVREFLKS